jgi:hypothetical protein
MEPFRDQTEVRSLLAVDGADGIVWGRRASGMLLG